VSPRDERGGSPSNSQAPGEGASLLAGERKPGRTAVSARDTKRTEMGTRTSEHPILPTKRGNAPQRIPRREGDVWAGTRRRDRRWGHRTPTRSQRNSTG
jgi:hypothetical protein